MKNKIIIQILYIHMCISCPFLSYARFSEGNMIFGYLYAIGTFVVMAGAIRYYLRNFRNPKNPENTENT